MHDLTLLVCVLQQVKPPPGFGGVRPPPGFNVRTNPMAMARASSGNSVLATTANSLGALADDGTDEDSLDVLLNSRWDFRKVRCRRMCAMW